MFGMPAVPFFKPGDNANKGEQVRGFGFLHDGSVDTIFRFHSANAFSIGAPEAANLEQFMLAFDSNLKPIVGQQVTLTSTNAAAAGPRINLMIAQAAAGACELTVKGVLAGVQRGWLRTGGGSFQSDRGGEPTLTDAQLRAHATVAGQERTYHCVPPGSGVRVGIDRDEDGFLDRDEIDAGSDPADPSSTPSGGTTTTSTTTTSTTTSTTSPPFQVLRPIPTTKLTLKDRSTPPGNPKARKVNFKSDTRDPTHPFHIVPPFQGSPDDPRTGGGVTVVVYNSVALGRRAGDRRSPRSGMARHRTEHLPVQGRAERRDPRGHLQARPDHVQRRQGALALHPERAVTGTRRGGLHHRQHVLLLGRPGQGDRQPPVDGDDRSRRQVRRPAGYARTALLHQSVIAA